MTSETKTKDAPQGSSDTSPCSNVDQLELSEYNDERTLVSFGYATVEIHQGADLVIIHIDEVKKIEDIAKLKRKENFIKWLEGKSKSHRVNQADQERIGDGEGQFDLGMTTAFDFVLEEFKKRII